MNIAHSNSLSINDLNQELQAAEDNNNFEKEYLAFTLQQSRFRNISPEIVIGQTSREQFPNSNDDASLLDLKTNSKILIDKGNQKNTGQSLMAFFFIRRFLEKISNNQKKIENLNYTILNLISDKASDSLNLLTYVKSIKRKELTFQAVQKIFKNEDKPQTQIEQIKQRLINLKNCCFNFFLLILNKIPLVQPESLFKLYWDFFATIIRGLLVFLIPLEIAFQPNILINQNQIISTILFIILQLDYFVKINTISYTSGKIISERLQILKKYMNQFFILDYFLTFILIFINQVQSTNIDLILLLLLTNYKYIFESFVQMDQISYLSRPQRGILGLIKFITTLIYIAHLFSCIWYWFSSIDTNYSWIITKGLSQAYWSRQYLEAFYFAIVTMLTIGYGDNVPINSIEKIITIIFILGACLWFSYSVNFIGGIINDITQNQVERNHKMRIINKYMIERGIPYALQFQIKEYLTYRWKEDDEVDLESEQLLLGQLSDELKESLDKQAYKEFILKCEFLQKYFSQEFRNALFKSIKRQIILPQNTFSSEINGEQHLCYIEQGVLIYQHQDNKYRSKINSQIESGKFLCFKEFIVQNPIKETFKAAGYVSLLILSKNDFIQTLKDFPQDFQKYCQLKDQITLENSINIFQQSSFCPVCNCLTHSLNKCPQVQLIPDSELVIKRNTFYQQQQRCKKKRRTIEKPIMTRAEMLFVQECARIFVQENSQLLLNQQRLQSVYELEDSNIIINTVGEEPQPSVKVFPILSLQQTISPIQQKLQTLKQLDIEIQQSDKIIEQKQQLKPKSLYKTGTRVYDHKFLRQNTKSPSLLSQLNEPSIEQEINNSSIEIEEYRKQINEFNQMHQDNIQAVYRKLLKYNDNSMDQFKNSIQFLYFQLSSQSVQDLDLIYNYEYYFPQYNLTNIIDSINKNKKQQQWQIQVLSKFQKYMLYPFNFILKFLKNKRSKAYVSIIHQMQKLQKVRNKLIMLRSLKGSFKRNQVLPDINLKSVFQLGPKNNQIT